MPIAEADLPIVLDLANRFEAIAAAGFAGEPHRDRLTALIRETRARPTIAAGVATALRLMNEAILDSDPDRRFAAKIAILEDAAAALVAQSDLESRA